MRNRAVAARAERELVRVLLRVVHELRDARDRQRRIHDQHERHRADDRDRRQRLEQLESGILVERRRRRDGRGSDQHRVAIGGRLRDRDGADVARRPGRFSTTTGCPQACGELLPDRAGEDVAGPARGERHDDGDGLRREASRVLRGCRCAEREAERDADRAGDATTCHDLPPVFDRPSGTTASSPLPTLWNGRLYSGQCRRSLRDCQGWAPPRLHAARRARSAVPPLRGGPRGTAALAKTISLLDLVAMVRSPPTFAELASSSGLPRGTLHRLLTALSTTA